MRKIKLSVVIPCFNEEERFTQGFLHYYSYLKEQRYPWELILVDDGSSDRTLHLMKKISRNKPQIRVISYEKNRGKGYAVAAGIKIANGQHVLFSDIDHSVSIDTIDTFFPYFENGFPVVIGSRRVKGAKFLKKQKPFREFLGRGFTLLVRILIDWKIRDATCGFKAFKAEAAQKIFKKITVYGWAFDAEILVLCKKFNFKVAQAPVAWRDARGTKVALSRDVLSSLKGLFRIYYNNFSGKYD